MKKSNGTVAERQTRGRTKKATGERTTLSSHEGSTPSGAIFKNCNVCGRGLVEKAEFEMGMCLICANEEVDD